MDAASFRNTRFEIRDLHQEANSWGATFSERGITGVPLAKRALHQSLFTEEQMRQIHDCLGMMEGVIASVVDAEEADLSLTGLDVPRAKVQELLNEAVDARALKATLEAEVAALEARKRELEASAVEAVPAQGTGER